MRTLPPELNKPKTFVMYAFGPKNAIPDGLSNDEEEIELTVCFVKRFIVNKVCVL